MRFKTIIAGVSLPFIIAACAPVDPGYGDAVAYNKAAQTIDPDPEYEWDDAKPGENGERGADAVQRYREGQVKQPSASTGRGQQGGQGGQGGLGGSGGSGGSRGRSGSI